MTDRTATLQFSDGAPSVTFPVLSGTLGPDVVKRKAARSLGGTPAERNAIVDDIFRY